MTDAATVGYRELDERARHLARVLRGRGLRPGDRLATLTGNSAAHVVLFFACARARLVLVPLCWRLTAPELAGHSSVTPTPACWWSNRTSPPGCRRAGPAGPAATGVGAR